MQWQFRKYWKQYYIGCVGNPCSISFYSKNAPFPSSLSFQFSFHSRMGSPEITHLCLVHT